MTLDEFFGGLLVLFSSAVNWGSSPGLPAWLLPGSPVTLLIVCQTLTDPHELPDVGAGK